MKPTSLGRAIVGCALVTCTVENAVSFGGAMDTESWTRWVIPLPKEITITGQVELPASRVGLRIRPTAGAAEQTAANELRALFQSEANATLTGKAFEIVMGVCDADGRVGGIAVPGIDRLRHLPNSSQAYVIRPIDKRTLVLAALDSKGVYYAAQTLRQLIDSRFHNGRVTIPLVSVTDWPDLAERGEWGGSANQDIVWMAHLKMNLVESHVHLRVTKDGRGVAKADEAMIALGRRHALKVVPIITHMDQLARTGIYERFPELKGKGPSAGNPHHSTVQAPCCSQPRFTNILSDWMRDLAAQKGVTDICVWLSENKVACGCKKCKAAGLSQHALEARCAVEAWRRVRKQFPNLGLRILLTQGSYPHNDQVLAQIPPGVGVTYYDGGRTYDSSRNPMIYPLLEKYAADGHWLGCYPQLTASWRIVCPWSGPQFIKFRMTEFVDKKLSCLCGYATPNNRLYEFNVTAAAEWSWNAHGRDEREFARAYFTRKHSRDPEAAADWAVMLGPVGWDVYGSRVPYSAFFGEAAAMIAGQHRPTLGKGMFRYFPTVQHFQQDLAACRKAMDIAKRLDSKPLLLETQVILGYVQMLDQIRKIAEMVATLKDVPDYEKRVELQQAFTLLSTAGMHVTRALDAWELFCGHGKRIGGSRLRDTVNVTQKTVTDIAHALEPMGIVDPLNPYRPHEIATWSTHDFDKTEKQHKVYDVTQFITTPGQWRVTFQYTSGWWGLHMSRVALAKAPKDHPQQMTEISVDKHESFTGARSENNTYTLTLKKLDKDALYFIVADIRGVTSVGKPENRRGCNGKVLLQAVLPENWETLLKNTRPLTDAQLEKRRQVHFHGKGIRVGVLEGGYGAQGILAALRAAPGFDAEPISAVRESILKACQVVIVPQPHGPLGRIAAKTLETFVRNGGGLITTHDAVGYRGHPVILAQICAGGVAHVKDNHWKAVAGTPITKEIPADQALPHSYYDHIELALGPKGKVAARAARSGKPVVIYGTAGKGRYVACGLALGLQTDTQDRPPTGAEKQLLLNCVKWAARP